MLVLGRGGAGKSVLARQLGELTGLPVTELDTLFWQPGLAAPDAAWWVARQDELVRRDAWILDGDLGPYDRALDVRLRAADTIIVLNFAFLRCAWRTVLRGRERADYWCWVWSYRRQSLPRIMLAIRQDAPHATLYVLRRPDMARRFLAEVGREIDNAAAGNAGDPTSSLSGKLTDWLHLHQSRPEHVPGCPRVTVDVRGRPSVRARDGHAHGSGGRARNRVRR
jgi:hypothetical protein